MARKTKEAQIQELKKQLEEYRGYIEKVDARNNELVNAEENTFLHSPTYIQLSQMIEMEKRLRTLTENSLANAKKRHYADTEAFRQVYLDNQLLMEKNGDTEYFVGVADDWRAINEYREFKEKIHQLEGKVEQLTESSKFQDEEIEKLIRQNAELQLRLEQADVMGSAGDIQRAFNVRGAGRKAMDDKMQGLLNEFSQLMSEGFTKQEIMKRLDISNATYYRYKKCVNSFKN